jgi:ubiquinone/menaquinone biosynthesis C-methylase UbiE
MKVYELSSETIEQHQWRDPLLRHLTNKILDLVDVPGGRALDIGCGAARLVTALARRGFEVDGVDIEAHVVEQAKTIAVEEGVPARLFVADFSKADPRFPDETYDESWYRWVGSGAACRFARFDDRFNAWKLGTTWVVKARKLGGPVQ